MPTHRSPQAPKHKRRGNLGEKQRSGFQPEGTGHVLEA